jgi:signal transduction histidine kinase
VSPRDQARPIVARLLVLVATLVLLGLATVAQVAGDPLPTDLLDLSASPYEPTAFPDRNVADAVASASGDDDATERLLARLTPFAAETVGREAFEFVASQVDDELHVEGVLERSPDLLAVIAGSGEVRYVVALQPAVDDESRIDGLLVNQLPLDGGPISDVEFVLLVITAVVLVGVGLARPVGGRRYVVAGVVTGLALLELAPWELAQDIALLAVPVALVVAVTALTDDRVPSSVVLATATAGALSLLPYSATDPGAVRHPWGHLAVIRSLQGQVDLLQRLAGVAVLGAVAVVWVWLATGPRLAALLTPTAGRWRLLGGHVACASIAIAAVSGLVRPAALDLTATGWSVAALLAIGIGRTAQLVQRRAALADVSARVADLASGRERELSDVIAHALDDPSARVLHRRSDGYVDREGHPVELPDDARTFTLLVLDGEVVGAVTHAPHVADDPERLRAACDAVKLSLANERLTAEIRARLDEVRASRARVLQAEDRARAQLERDLHDGAQQRLTAAMLQLRVVQQQAGDPLVATRLAPIGDELQRAIDEIRELARGVRPSALDAGLGAAAEDLAERAPLPVIVHDRLGRRLDPRIETVAWFVLNEALVNASRHADAAHVEIHLEEDVSRSDVELVVTVVDDGCGIDPRLEVAAGRRPASSSGTGLVGLFDRVDAHGGTLTVRRGHESGTIIEVRLPCAR